MTPDERNHVGAVKETPEKETLAERLTLIERAIAEVARQWNLSPGHAPASHALQVKHGLRSK